MLENNKSARKRLTVKKIIQHFFQGILVIAPIAITLYLVIWLFTTLDGLLGFSTGIPGLGLAVILLGITVIGYLSSTYIVKKFFGWFDHLLEHTPVIKYLYSSIKDVLSALMGKKKKFEHPVLVSLYNSEVWEIGFITREDAREFALEDVMAVYIPMALSIAGKVYFVKTDRIKRLDNITAADAMKFAVSGGLAGGDEDEEEENKETTDVELIKKDLDS